MQKHQIRRARSSDHRALLALWEKSVRATHDFLTEADIDVYRPLASDALADERIELWTLVVDGTTPIGFIGVSAHAIEALFVDPGHVGAGWGRRLVAHAHKLQPGCLSVAVNEENIGARRFYEALGFTMVGRSDRDDAGRAHPLLHLRRTGIF